MRFFFLLIDVALTYLLCRVFNTHTPKKSLNFMKAFHILLHINFHVSKLAPPTTLNFVPRLTEKLSDLATSYYILSHLVTPYFPCLIEN